MPPSGSSRPSQLPHPPVYADHWKLVGPSDAGLQPSQHLESYSSEIGNPSRFNQAVNRSRACPARRNNRGHPGSAELTASEAGGPSQRPEVRAMRPKHGSLRPSPHSGVALQDPFDVRVGNEAPFA